MSFPSKCDALDSCKDPRDHRRQPSTSGAGFPMNPPSQYASPPISTAFFGTSENGVTTPTWIAECVYVLVAIIKKRLNIEVSL